MAIGTIPYNPAQGSGEWRGDLGGGPSPENAQWPENFGGPASFGGAGNGTMGSDFAGGEGTGQEKFSIPAPTQQLGTAKYPDGTPSSTSQSGPVYTGYPGTSPTRTDRAVSSLLPPPMETMEGQ